MLKIERTAKLPKEFSLKGSSATLSQALHIYRERSHVGLVKVKTRAEVDRTTKKLYKQKGTGGARHGSRSAPIFVGGGKAHGPRPLKRVLKLSTGLKRSALGLALSLKAKEDKVVIVSGFSTLKATKEVQELLNRIKAQKFIIAVSEKNWDKARFVRNIKNVDLMPYKNLNAYKVYFGGMLVIDAEALK